MNSQFFQPHFPANPILMNLCPNFNIPKLGSAQFSETSMYQKIMIRARNNMLMQNMCLQRELFSSINITDANINAVKQETFNVKQEAARLKLESPSTVQDVSLRGIASQIQTPMALEKSNWDYYLKMEIEKIITFLLLNMGKNNQTQIDNFRRLYIHHPCLLQIYDKLVMKYFSVKKCREDIVRYILRKVFKVIRSSIMKKEKVCNKKAAIILCKKYFQKSFERIQESGLNGSNEDELIEFFMPYKKKSKNRTMNTAFVLEVFSSEDFCKEYQQFLAEFDSFLEADNNKKKEKLMVFLVECIKNDSLWKIGNYNRLPWLDLWIRDTKNIAFDLVPEKKLISDYKKIKQE